MERRRSFEDQGEVRVGARVEARVDEEAEAIGVAARQGGDKRDFELKAPALGEAHDVRHLVATRLFAREGVSEEPAERGDVRVERLPGLRDVLEIDRLGEIGRGVRVEVEGREPLVADGDIRPVGDAHVQLVRAEQEMHEGGDALRDHLGCELGDDVGEV